MQQLKLLKKYIVTLEKHKKKTKLFLGHWQRERNVKKKKKKYYTRTPHSLLHLPPRFCCQTSLIMTS